MAFERLYRRHLSGVHRTARWLLGTDDVDDAVQEVFVRLWQKLHTFEGRSAVASWLHRVSTNVLLRYRTRLGRQGAREKPFDPADDRTARVRPGLRMDLDNAVTTLPERARTVFVLHDMQGLSHEEIAGLMKTDIATSRSQLHRARRLLRQRLIGGPA